MKIGYPAIGLTGFPLRNTGSAFALQTHTDSGYHPRDIPEKSLKIHISAPPEIVIKNPPNIFSFWIRGHEHAPVCHPAIG